jgi:putative sugar O-methyltransferase
MLRSSNPESISYKLSTSLSDNMVYPDFCAKASIDSILFSNFRKNSVYQQILEHVSEKQGKLYLEEIKKYNADLLNSLNTFKLNDEWGNPDVSEYPEIGVISPTTLRYIKVLSDLKKLFHNLDNLDICEIGVGYGGQCRIINGIFKPSKYTLVDIKPALMLAQRYLDNYILHSVMIYKTMNELIAQKYDLVISNYAFTELTRSVQDVYLQKIILNSKRGYITYNDINPASFQSYKKEDLLKIIPNSRILEEVPLTHPNNCILIWGE